MDYAGFSLREVGIISQPAVAGNHVRGAIMRTLCCLAVAAALLSIAAVAEPTRFRDDREMQALTRRVVALEKENKALKKALDAEKRQSNARDLLLAGWFDEYHPRGGNSRYHRNQVEWKKR